MKIHNIENLNKEIKFLYNKIKHSKDENEIKECRDLILKIISSKKKAQLEFFHRMREIRRIDEAP